MAYIEKEPLIEFITKGLNNPDKTKAFGYDAIEILTEIKYAPTADVAPKSEVERLTVELDAMRGAANSYKMHYENAKAEVAREIFEEIEKIMDTLIYDYKKVSRYQDGDTVWYVKDFLLAELKKKYMEEKE